MASEAVDFLLCDRSLLIDGRPVPLSPKFFAFYCFLAFERVRGSNRFVTCGEVRRLQGWRRSSPESAGKQIHRHVRKMNASGIALVESPARGATKLFRLKAPPDRISFDVPLPDVRTYLGLDLAVGTSPQAVHKIVEFSTTLALAETALDRGDLDAAKKAIEEVGRGARIVRERVQLLFLHARLLERQGKYAAALRKAERALGLCAREGADYLTTAQAHIMLGWMARGNREHAKAGVHYGEAHKRLEASRHFRELGQIARGLGHLARAEGDLVAARCHFLASLEYASADGRSWDIQAALFNLGLAETEWGDAVRDRTARRAAYMAAQQWVEKCVAITNKTGVGKDSGEAEALLSRIVLGLNNSEAAMSWAARALASARAARNKRGEAAALACLGQAMAMKAPADARKHLLAASVIYRDLGYESEASRLAALTSRTAQAEGQSRSQISKSLSTA